MNSDILPPAIAIYIAFCVALNFGINELNRRWRDSRQLWPDQLPPAVALWVRDNHGVKVFHGSAGHPFTPLFVILGVLGTVAAVTAVAWNQPMLGQEFTAILLIFLAVGGAIMTAGDAYRYLVYG